MPLAVCAGCAADVLRIEPEDPDWLGLRAVHVDEMIPLVAGHIDHFVDHRRIADVVSVEAGTATATDDRCLDVGVAVALDSERKDELPRTAARRILRVDQGRNLDR